MARLIPLILLFGVGIFVLIAAQNRGSSERSSRAYRPRKRFSNWFDSQPAEGMGEPFVVTRGDIDGLRDAYSGARLDGKHALVRCGQCLAFYHAESVAVLVRENRGRCAGCGSSDFRAVSIAGH
jgi:hypothetical protein